MISEPICLWKSTHRQWQCWPLKRFPRMLFNERNQMQTIETTHSIITHPSAPTIIFRSQVTQWSAPSDDQSGFTQHTQFTSSGATDSSSNCNYLPQDSVGLSTLQIMLGADRCGYGSLTKLYTVSDYPMIQLSLPISFVDWWAECRKWSSDRRSLGSSDWEVY